MSAGEQQDKGASGTMAGEVQALIGRRPARRRPRRARRSNRQPRWPDTECALLAAQPLARFKSLIIFISLQLCALSQSGWLSSRLSICLPAPPPPARLAARRPFARAGAPLAHTQPRHMRAQPIARGPHTLPGALIFAPCCASCQARAKELSALRASRDHKTWPLARVRREATAARALLPIKMRFDGESLIMCVRISVTGLRFSLNSQASLFFASFLWRSLGRAAKHALVLALLDQSSLSLSLSQAGSLSPSPDSQTRADPSRARKVSKLLT